MAGYSGKSDAVRPDRDLQDNRRARCNNLERSIEMGGDCESAFCWEMSSLVNSLRARDDKLWSNGGAHPIEQDSEGDLATHFALIIADRGDDAQLARTLTSLGTPDRRGAQVIVVAQQNRREAIVQVLTDAGVPDVILHFGPDGSSIAQLELSALDLATGTFIGFLSPGDRLAPHALRQLRPLAVHDSVSVIYSDEQWVNAKGKAIRPRFKSAWDPDAHLGRDHFGKFCLLRRSHVESSGGLRLDHVPAHHYDLHSRIAFSVPPPSIRHVPLVLCSRSAPSEDDPASRDRLQSEALAYADAARAVAQQSAERLSGGPVTVSPAPLVPLINRIHWHLPKNPPLVSILVPTRDRADLLRNCVSGLRHSVAYPNFEVLILDNGSIEPETFDLFAELETDKRIRVVPAPGPFNFARINNLGVQQSRGEIIVFMNNDIEVLRDSWLPEMVSQALRPDVGCVGARLLYGDRKIQHAGIVLQAPALAMHVFRRLDENAPGYDAQLASTRTYAAVTAACLAVRRTIFKRAGGFDEQELQVSFQDVDFCLKVEELGYRNICTPYEPLLHLEGASRSGAPNPEKVARERRELGCLMRRWSDRFAGDRFAHPCVRLDWEQGETIVAPSHAAAVHELAR